MRISNNISALTAFNSLNSTNNALQKTIQQLDNAKTSVVTAEEEFKNVQSEQSYLDARKSELDANKVYINALAVLQKAETELNEYNPHKLSSIPSYISGRESDLEPSIKLDFSKADTSRLTNTSNMFLGCVQLLGINLNGADLSHVTNMSNMFKGCLWLRDVRLPAIDTSKVNISGMFAHCSSLSKIDMTRWNLGNDRNVSGVFKCCEYLRKVDLTGVEIGNARLSSIFRGCERLNDLIIGSSSGKTLTAEYLNEVRNLISEFYSFTVHVRDIQYESEQYKHIKEILASQAIYPKVVYLNAGEWQNGNGFYINVDVQISDSVDDFLSDE